jgi:hypothetical protein
LEHTISTPENPELQRVVAAWPTLPANIKAAIVALVGVQA